MQYRLINFGIANLLWIIFVGVWHANNAVSQDFPLREKKKAVKRVIVAESGRASDIKNALTRAKPGDLLRIPEGYYLFNESVEVPAGISIVGAGREKTIIKKIGALSFMFIFDGSNGGQVQFSRIKLIGLEGALPWEAGLHLKNDCKDFRIFNCEFEGFGHAGIIIRGNAKGVIDHNNFINCYYPGLGYGIEVIGDGDTSWSHPLVLGTEDAVFIEDCTFSGCRHSVASSYGSRYVFRYNTILDCKYNHHAVDAHGKGTWDRGSRSYEIYGNFIQDSEPDPIYYPVGIGIRGGDGVIFNNRIVFPRGYISYHIVLTNDISDCVYPCQDQIRELYIWGNTKEGEVPLSQKDIYLSKTGIEELLQVGRDYFLYKKPGYTSYSYPHPLTKRPRLIMPMILLIGF